MQVASTQQDISNAMPCRVKINAASLLGNA